MAWNVFAAGSFVGNVLYQIVVHGDVIKGVIIGALSAVILVGAGKYVGSRPAL